MPLIIKLHWSVRQHTSATEGQGKPESRVSPINISDVSDSEATSSGLESLKQHITKLKESRRRSHKRRKQEMAKLKESKVKFERDYQHELYQRTKDKECWQRTFADKDKETKALKREMVTLRKQLKELRIDLRAKSNELTIMSRFICDICNIKQISRLTRCGHVFCKECLDDWFKTAAEESMRSNGVPTEEATCPMCRQTLDQRDDIWPIHLPEPEVCAA